VYPAISRNSHRRCDQYLAVSQNIALSVCQLNAEHIKPLIRIRLHQPGVYINQWSEQAAKIIAPQLHIRVDATENAVFATQSPTFPPTALDEPNKYNVN
jgi:hypothetical protein